MMIFVYLIDYSVKFQNFKLKFTNFFMRHYFICMFLIGFLIKFLYSNLFSFNKDFSFILYAEDIVQKKKLPDYHGIVRGPRRVPITDDIVVTHTEPQVEEVSF
jgi:hypothetical protein